LADFSILNQSFAAQHTSQMPDFSLRHAARRDQRVRGRILRGGWCSSALQQHADKRAAYRVLLPAVFFVITAIVATTAVKPPGQDLRAPLAPRN
jgi:hypothetical protein